MTSKFDTPQPVDGTPAKAAPVDVQALFQTTFKQVPAKTFEAPLTTEWVACHHDFETKVVDSRIDFKDKEQVQTGAVTHTWVPLMKGQPYRSHHPHTFVKVTNGVGVCPDCGHGYYVK